MLAKLVECIKCGKKYPLTDLCPECLRSRGMPLKGKECPYKSITCQEEYCEECQIFIDRIEPSKVETLTEAVRLLKSINCPEPILDALWVFGLTVHDDDIKLRNWDAWAEGLLVEGECKEGNLLASGNGDDIKLLSNSCLWYTFRRGDV
jgi:hypothetical protein